MVIRFHAVQALLGLVTLCTPCAASMVTINWELEVNRKFDYTGQLDTAFVSFTGTGTVTFDNIVTSVTDYGQSTATVFGGFSSGIYGALPLAPLVGANPFDGGRTTVLSWVSASVNDWRDDFITVVSQSANITSLSPDGGQTWRYGFVINAMGNKPSMGGTGAADYAFTPELLLAWYTDFAANSVKGQGYFVASSTLYDSIEERAIGGGTWSGYATITGITTVPEPATGLSIIGGLVAFASLRLVRRKL